VILKNKVAIVTGASRGIGKAISIGFAQEGADVVVAARSDKQKDERLPGTIHETAEEVAGYGRRALPVKCDVTSEESIQGMVDAALKEFGKIDILVNNAGVAFYYPVVETPLKRWELVVDVNLKGVFLCSKAVLPSMIDKKCGSIINISSLAADERDEGTVPTGLAYAASKAAVDRFTWGLATEVGKHNIAVNCIKPKNVVSSEGMKFWVSEEGRTAWEPPDRMVKCAVFLASQNAAGVTGSVSTDHELCAWHGL
jgi:NAD(P)-dependent dehydrogenase (short-subunit alcohol dehydrogenase family)